MTFYMSEPKKPAPKNPEKLWLSGEVDMGDTVSYWEFDGETVADMITVLQGIGEKWGMDARFKRIDNYDSSDELKLIVNEREETEEEHARRQMSEMAAWFKYEDEMKKYKKWSMENAARTIKAAEEKLAQLQKEYKNEYPEG